MPNVGEHVGGIESTRFVGKTGSIFILQVDLHLKT